METVASYRIVRNFQGVQFLQNCLAFQILQMHIIVPIHAYTIMKTSTVKIGPSKISGYIMVYICYSHTMYGHIIIIHSTMMIL